MRELASLIFIVRTKILGLKLKQCLAQRVVTSYCGNLQGLVYQPTVANTESMDRTTRGTEGTE